jgi:hypothetical protein
MSAGIYEEEPRADMALQQPSALEEPSPALLRAELITEGFCMVGRLDLPTAHRRLVDLLNFHTEPVIVLHDIEARGLGSESDKVFNWPMAQIRREAIILAIPHEHRLPASEGRHRLEYVAKEPHRASFLLPAFAVVGDLHLAKGVEINVARPMSASDFAPLSDAEAIYLPHPTLVWRAAVIIVNVAKAEVSSLSPDLFPQQPF